MFHKKCTSKKDAKGAWQSTAWTFNFCSSEISSSSSINQCERAKLPPLTGRQRKSNVTTSNPENEFLRSQIDTLKGVISQSEEEIKKLRESNDLKSRRINQLEGQLLLAHDSLYPQSKSSEANFITSVD